MGKYALVFALLVGLGNLAFAREDGRYASRACAVATFDGSQNARSKEITSMRTPSGFPSRPLIRPRKETLFC
jgi:hypothetical protein